MKIGKLNNYTKLILWNYKINTLYIKNEILEEIKKDYMQYENIKNKSFLELVVHQLECFLWGQKVAENAYFNYYCQNYKIIKIFVSYKNNKWLLEVL